MLHFSVEIDEDVPTGDEVDARKRRVFQKAVLGEQDDIPQFAPDLVLVAFPGEKSPQPFLGHIGFDRGRIAAFPRQAQGDIVEIRSEDLDLTSNLLTARLLEQQNGDRVGLLAGGAAGNPDTNRGRRLPSLRTAEG